MLRSRLASILIGSLALAISVLPASADPVQVTGGAFFVTDFPVFDGTFDNFGTVRIAPSLTVHLSGREDQVPVRSDCAPCSPGQTLNLSGAFQLRGPTFIAPFDTGVRSGASYSTGVLSFDVAPVLFPRGDAFQVFAFSPFTFQGFAEIREWQTEELLFRGALQGSGVARVSLLGNRNSRTFHQMEYGFGQDASAPVPEPGTLLLFASAAAGAWGRAARRRRRTPLE
jgi:hypothetical protein